MSTQERVGDEQPSGHAAVRDNGSPPSCLRAQARRASSSCDCSGTDARAGGGGGSTVAAAAAARAASALASRRLGGCCGRVTGDAGGAAGAACGPRAGGRLAGLCAMGLHSPICARKRFMIANCGAMGCQSSLGAPNARITHAGVRPSFLALLAGPLLPPVPHDLSAQRAWASGLPRAGSAPTNLRRVQGSAARAVALVAAQVRHKLPPPAARSSVSAAFLSSARWEGRRAAGPAGTGA